MEHRLDVKVYYEDTDCLGIVYHANYLKYMERGRSEYISLKGKPINELNAEGMNFAVYEMKIKFLKAAKLGDILQVVTKPGNDKSEYRRRLIQRVELNGTVMVEAEVDVVCLDNNKQLRVFPAGIMD
ncbi:MAG: YbgC/FadM family acyl-CoA thioesterase [Spirochaetes bacterium]|nr:YbgC/FadM family acyl-CoA thioesterase [Spirochaetota bacterium]